jgi:hypothetical protein
MDCLGGIENMRKTRAEQGQKSESPSDKLDVASLAHFLQLSTLFQ